MWIFGSNESCGLGLGLTQTELKKMGRPTKHKFLDNINIIKIACGFTHICCIDDKYDCYLFGCNDHGQIGNGNKIDERLPYKFQSNLNFVNKKIINADCGREHTVLLTVNNQVISFGSNYVNQCSPNYDICEYVNPHLLNKETEIGVEQTDYIETIMADTDSTMIVTSLNKKFIK